LVDAAHRYLDLSNWAPAFEVAASGIVHQGERT
jgi:hypothetical protein